MELQGQGIPPDEREQVRNANEREMLMLQRRFRLHFNAADYKNWRPTLRTHGDIPGVLNNLTIICTNGILGYFIIGDNDIPPQILLGHIQCFTGEVKPLYSITPTTKVKEPSKTRRKKPSLMEQALALLQGHKPK